MTERPAISVLTTAYNAEGYLAQAIKSILNQTFRNFEFIIIDDASTDKTWLIIQEFQKQDHRIVALRNETNLGIASNRNALLKNAKGKYMAWQDADDISLPNRLEKQYQLMENNPALGICGGWLQFFSDQQNLSIRKYDADDKTLRKKIFRYSPVAQPAAMIRKEALDQAGNYDSKLKVAEDLDMAFRLGQNYKFANIQEITIKYRLQPSSITYQRLRLLEKNTLKIRLKFAKTGLYRFSLVDLVYNLIQFLTLYLLPAKWRVAFFNLIRNSKS